MIEQETGENPLYSLIPLDNFKALASVDDRDDKTARFCLVTASLSIEQYCKRKFLRKQYFETFKFSGSLVLPFKEYPVSEILLVSAFNGQQYTQNNGTLIEPAFYRPMVGNGYNEEMIFELLMSPSLKPYEYEYINVTYIAGYVTKSNDQLAMSNEEKDKSKGDIYERIPDRNLPLAVPEDLVAACLELAAWNFNRYKGRRIGMSGNIRGAGVQGEHFELSMPENVRSLIEPYRRKTI